jgi:sulfur relay (sulfurtransferase) DsrF/TusC family protein
MYAVEQNNSSKDCFIFDMFQITCRLVHVRLFKEVGMDSTSFIIAVLNSVQKILLLKKLNSVTLVRERTMPTASVV